MNQDYLFTQVLNTLPLKGHVMSRNSEGDKVIDGSDEVVLPRWRDPNNQHYSPKSETETAPLLAAIIDRNLVFIDWDVKEWFEKAIELANKEDTPPAYVAISDKGEGHIGYKIPDYMVRDVLSLDDSEELNSGTYSKALDKLLGNGLKGKIDIQFGGKKLIYLASSGNHTKTLVSEPLTSIDQFTDLPEVLVYYIQSLLYTNGVTTRTITTYETDDQGLYGDLAEAFVNDATGSYDRNFFQTVTPAKWRDKVKPDFHPSNLDEKPHDYLYAFATKLGSDASISEEVFTKVINKINSLCIPPKHSADVVTQIIEPITSGSARIDDEPIWKYNSDWKTETLTLTNKVTKESESVYLDRSTSKYLWVNLTSGKYRLLSGPDSNLHLKSLDSKKFTKWQEKVLPIETILDIRKEYGVQKNHYGFYFNTYKIPKAIQVFHDPDSWEKFHAVDKEFFEFLHNVLGTEKKVDYWLRWMATRMKTRNFSKVVWMFDGIGGAGKTPLGEIMANMVGALEDRQILRSMSKDNTDDKYNTYLVNAWVVMIDEIGDFHEKAKTAVAAMVKNVSGTEGVVEIRGMNTDWAQTEVHSTFVLTTNRTFRLFAEANQTRLFYAKTRTKVPDSWVDRGLVTKWVRSEEFTFSLASYLAQNVEPLTHSEYTRVPAWVYEGDKDWKDYNRLESDPEMELLDIFMTQDKQGLIDFLGVEDWSEVPHMAPKKEEWNEVKGDFDISSLIILSKRKGTTASIQGMVSGRLNYKRFLSLLKDEDRDRGGAYTYNNKFVSKWYVPSTEYLERAGKTELNFDQNKDMKEKL